MQRREFLIGTVATAVAATLSAPALSMPALAKPKSDKMVFVMFRRFIDPSWSENQFIEVQTTEQYANPEYVGKLFVFGNGDPYRKAFVVKEEDIPNQDIFPFKNRILTMRNMLEKDYEAYLAKHATVLYHDWDRHWKEMTKHYPTLGLFYETA
jgi:hypothetical protein